MSAMDMTQKHLSKKISVLLVTALLMGTAGLATAAATDAGDTIIPMMKGEWTAYERGLSRHTTALAVHVGQFDGEHKSPLEGATVEIYTTKRFDLSGRPLPDDGEEPTIFVVTVPAEPITSKETDADGRAVFELRPGDYVVAVEYGDLSARETAHVGKDTRVGVAFGPDGEAHWFTGDRHDVADRGEPVPLFVQVGTTGENGRSPEANATVKVLKAVRGDGDRMTFETVAENLTNEGGRVMFHLLPGAYYLDITTPDGKMGDKAIRLGQPTGVLVLFDEEGEANFRTYQRGDRFERP